MRDSGKDRFSNELCKQWGNVALVDKSTVIDPVIVWDGDMLLYSRIRTWKRGGTLGQTVEEYNSILKREARTTSEKVVPVFHVYLQNTPKDHTHKKRVPVRALGMSIRPELCLDIKADMFLSNPINKQGFIDLLCDTITSAPSCSKIELRQCEADADTEIVSTAVEHLHSNKPVLLKADDTDILVLCLHQECSSGLYLERCGAVYDISKFRDNLPPLLQRFVIVLHGFLGNDTVSGFLWPAVQER